MADSSSKEYAVRMELLQKEVTGLVNELSGIVENLAKMKRGAANEFKQKEGEVKERIKDLRQRVSNAKDSAQGVFNQTQAFVEDRPIESALIAFGVGYVLGKIFGRR